MPGRRGTVAAQPIPEIISATDIKMLPVFREQVDGALRKVLGESAILHRRHANQLLELRLKRLDNFSERSIHIVHYSKTANAAHHAPARKIEVKSHAVAGRVHALVSPRFP
jgi:hypothetical protein